jgi:hypothetical protein
VLLFDEGSISYSCEVDAAEIPKIISIGSDVVVTVKFRLKKNTPNHIHQAQFLRVRRLLYKSLHVRTSDIVASSQKTSIVELESWSHQFRTSFKMTLEQLGMVLYQSLGAHEFQNLDDVLAEISIEPEGLIL